MAKKKSKTQKSKQNQKKKLQTTKVTTSTTKKQQSTKTPKNTKTESKKVVTPKKDVKKVESKKQLVDKKDVKYNVALDIKETKEPKESKKIVNTDKQKQLVDKEQVKYNVVLTKDIKEEKVPEQKEKKSDNKYISKIKNTLTSAKQFFSNLRTQEKNKETKPENKYIIRVKKALYKAKEFFNKLLPKKKEEVKPKKYVKKDKKNKKTVENKPKNIFLRIIYELKHNFHIIFNVALIITYITLLIGLIRTNAFTQGTIIYISSIVIFLMIVAISYNKYISGKIFTLMIIVGMSLGIYYMQYTYDFINNLNSNQYEYKTYYVVTFNNGQNKSIYNINNKKVCLLKDNSINIERKLNTKLDSVIYIEHEDPNQLYKDFYNTNCRAIIVNENQYKYLINNIEDNSRNIKILYEFKANGKK